MSRTFRPRTTPRPQNKHRGVSRPSTQVVGGADPDSIWNHAIRFGRWMEERAYSPRTIAVAVRTLHAFAGWCAERGLIRPQEITRPILERWQRHLFLHRKENGEPLSVHSQIIFTQPLRMFFKWLSRENHILYNPASELVLPRTGRRLPRNIMSISEVERVMAIPDLETGLGIRDRAILEVLYSTGIRRGEVINLHLHDIDYERGVLMVREGKGKKDRMIPIGIRALDWINTYLNRVRPDLASGFDDGTLFLSKYGMSFTSGGMAVVVRRCIDDAKLGKRGSCHMFRHTMATLMLEGGADIRFIQAMLGHTDLSTTEIYTQVSIKALKAIHTATHPGKPITVRGAHGLEDEAAQAIRDRASRCAGGTGRRADGSEATALATPTAAALLSVLEYEADVEVEEAQAWREQSAGAAGVWNGPKWKQRRGNNY